MSGKNTLYATICVPCKGSGRVTFIDGERKCFNCGGKGWVYVDKPEKRSDKMKLSEMLTELEKDHTKKFKGTRKGDDDITCSFSVGCVDFKYDREHSTCSDSFRIGQYREWEEIKQPITFNEVLNNGKLFKCKHPDIKEEGYWSLSRFIQMLYTEDFNSYLIFNILNTGEFYN